MSEAAERKRLGAWYTPMTIVATIVEAIVTPDFVAERTAGGHSLRVLDPSCGDGRFLVAVAERVQSLGGSTSLTGIDIDPRAVVASRAAAPDATVIEADALDHPHLDATFDLVIGNPPFLSQLASATTRGGSSARGVGPYGDAAVEFLSLASDLVDPVGGRIALVLPQSVLSSRDAAAVREVVDRRSTMVWSWWSPERLFDAQVYICVLGFEFGRASPEPSGNWSGVVTRREGIPDVPASLEVAGSLGDRARFNANFRDEYYGMVPAAGDHASGPPLISSALIDPGRSLWGRRPITFASNRYDRPRLDLDRLDPSMREWARRRLVPKVLIANQTRIVEAVCDPLGEWLPAVPVIGAYPTGTHWDDTDGAHDRRSAIERSAWEIAAVLTSPFASTWLWHRRAGTGMSATAIRLSPEVLASLPWPAGDLTDAVEALRAGDIRGCGSAVDRAYAIANDDEMSVWWTALLDRIEARQPASGAGAPPPAPTPTR